MSTHGLFIFHKYLELKINKEIKRNMIRNNMEKVMQTKSNRLHNVTGTFQYFIILCICTVPKTGIIITGLYCILYLY